MDTQTTAHEPSAALRRLLDDELAFSPSFRRHYSNHLAMALVALDQMHAPAEVLDTTFEAHVAGESEPRDDVEALDERLAEIARLGIAETVRQRLPGLADAPGTALFHPAIRLAYGLDAGHQGQVAAALLDWERRRDDLPAETPVRGGRRLVEVAAALADAPPGTWRHTFDLHGIAQRSEVAAALDGLAVDQRALDDLSGFAIAAHVAADDFVTLHLVTGARAVRAIVGMLDDETAMRLLASSAQVMAIAYAAVGAPPLLDDGALDAIRRAPMPSRSQIEQRAIGDHDPHVIKLANVGLIEEARSGEALYRYVAARVVGLAPDVAELVPVGSPH